jgi:leader peptidase (prepilin peptidase)/N-methyltransferase
MIELFIFVIGIAVGSFLNVCIYRLPKEESVVNPPSHCVECGMRLKPLDMIPIVSYLWLRGRCRYCGSTFSVRYAVVEFLTGLIFVWCFKVAGLRPEIIKLLTLSSFLLVITFIDYDHQLILDKLLIWFAGAGLIINFLLNNSMYWLTYIGWTGLILTNYVSYLDLILTAFVGGAFMLLLAVISRGGMGGGDIKFVAALGLWFGWKLTLVALLLSFIIGGLGGGLLLVLRLKKRRDLIPFGPFIAVGSFITALYGKLIILWYWGILQ